jgi:membrane protein DedA with SNARE-associated domain
MLDAAHWLVYLLAFAAPFVQEDAAVIGATGAGMTTEASEAGLIVAVFAGLVASDIWKYWAGRFAERSRFAAKWIADPRVAAARERVLTRMGVALLVARLVPGTRVPLYIACGLFRAPFARFCFYVALSGALYVGAAYVLFHSLDMMAGERVRTAAPFIVLALVGVVLALNWLKPRKVRPV